MQAHSSTMAAAVPGLREGGSSGSSASPRPSGNGGGGVSAPRPQGGGFNAPRPAGGQNFSQPQQNGGSFSQRMQNYGNRQQPGASANRGNFNNYPQRVGTVNSSGAAIRGNFDVTSRSGFSSSRFGVNNSANYRTSPAVGYGRGGHFNGTGYWGSHGYNHYNHGYYNTYYRPRLGFNVSVLPYGYYPFYYGDYQYFYSDGLYYQYDNSSYTVVDPPIGAEITTLPDKAQSIVINGQQYYELNGVYYQPITKDDGSMVYQIAGKDGNLDTNTNVQDDQPQGPQMGDIIPQLPPDCRKISVNGQKLYVSQDGVYYQELTDGNGNKTYKVVGLPSDEPEQN